MALCSSALCGTGKAVACVAQGLLQGWKKYPVSTDGFWLPFQIDVFWYCEDLEKEPVPCPRLDLLFFLKIALSTFQSTVLDLSSSPPVSVLLLFPYSTPLSPPFSPAFPC